LLRLSLEKSNNLLNTYVIDSLHLSESEVSSLCELYVIAEKAVKSDIGTMKDGIDFEDEDYLLFKFELEDLKKTF
jgi:hypothetical protein